MNNLGRGSLLIFLVSMGLLLAPDYSLSMDSNTGFIGVVSHLTNTHPPNDNEFCIRDTLMTMVNNNLGVNLVRTSVRWENIQPEEDIWDWETMDSVVVTTRNLGVKLLFVVLSPPMWAYPAHDHLSEWRIYLDSLVTRYGDDVSYWEIWNEPNLEKYWPQNAPRQAYVDLLEVSYNTIKAKYPNAVVMNGGIATGPQGDYFTFFEDVFPLNMMDFCDAVAFHAYPFRGNELYDALDDLDSLMIYHNGVAKPVWITEFGLVSWTKNRNDEGTHTRQANVLLKTGLVAWIEGVDKYIIFHLKDYLIRDYEKPDNYEVWRRGNGQWYGLCNEYLELKLSAEAVYWLSLLITNNQFISRDIFSDGTLIELRGNEGQRTFITWGLEARDSVRSYITGPYSVEDYSGFIDSTDLYNNWDDWYEHCVLYWVDGAQSPGRITLSISPEDTSVIIPYDGGAVHFTVSIINDLEDAINYDVWFMAVLPNGNQYGPTIGPTTITLEPGDTLVRNLVQRIPRGAPAGYYEYQVHIGNYPDEILISDNFIFSKLYKIGGESIGYELEQGFEGRWVPDGWANIQNCFYKSSLFPGYWSKTDGTTPFGRYSSTVWWAFDKQDEWIITPTISIADTSILTFWTYGYPGSSYGDHYYVKASTDSGNTWTVLFDLSNEPETGEYNEWETPYTIDLSSFNNQDVVIGFHAKDNDIDKGLWYLWSIDQVTVTVNARVINLHQPHQTKRLRSMPADLIISKEMALLEGIRSSSDLRDYYNYNENKQNSEGKRDRWVIYYLDDNCPLNVGDSWTTLGTIFADENQFSQFEVDELNSREGVRKVRSAHVQFVGGYPNPFNSNTLLKYEISEESIVELQIVNILGQLVKSWVIDSKNPGVYWVHWDGTNNLNEEVSAGVYIAILRAAPIYGNFKSIKKTHKLVYLK